MSLRGPLRFDLNDYSVPHTHVRRPLSVLADEHRIRILDGAQELVSRARSWDRGQQIERPVHVEALVEHKRAARAHRACDRLAQAAPASALFLQRAAERGESLRTTTSALTDLLDRYGARALEVAITEALQRGVPHQGPRGGPCVAPGCASGAGACARGGRNTAAGGAGAVRARCTPGRSGARPRPGFLRPSGE